MIKNSVFSAIVGSAANSTAVNTAMGNQAGGLIMEIPAFVTKIALAGFVIFIGCIIIRIGKGMINRIVDSRREKNIERVQQVDTLRSLITSIFTYVMYFVIVTAVLALFGVNISSLIAVAGVGGVAIGFGAQTLVQDIISGLFIWIEGSIAVGDIVEINGLTGEVESIALRTTVIRNGNGNLYSIPNGDIRTVTNMSQDFKKALVDIRCPYDVPLERLESILKEEMEIAAVEVEGLEAAPDVLSVISFDPDAIIIRLAAKCPVKENWRIERDLRCRVKRRFEKEGIEMPHYQRPAVQ